ncbi:MAG TPA: siderophore-interacting protein [Pseudolysinimonas sp.]|nr:siderophore-interacting protein [Pseudolysinimonas sp.]
MTTDPMNTVTRFDRVSTPHQLVPRRATVHDVQRPAQDVVRVTLGGPDFDDFVSTGPADHVKLFVPDEASGVLRAPTLAPDGSGFVRPDGPTITRDYTPLEVRSTSGGVVVDVDFMLHPHAGPVSRWADRAVRGDSAVVVGPRGSRSAPADPGRFVAVVDETALPSLTRWLRDLAGVPATVIAATIHDETWLRGYLGAAITAAELRVVGTGERAVDALATLGDLGDDVFVFAAGEATALTDVRRYLVRTLRMAPEQLAITGYWRLGVVNFDHHEPLDE